jgi:hypothetical protein
MNQTPHHAPLDNDGDSVDLVQIIRDIAKEKKRFLKNGAKVLAVWLVLFIAYALLTFNSSTYYSLVVGLTFPQASQGKYPNGSPFSPSDIVSTSILEKVWSENKLGDRGIKLQTFQNSISALPYTGEINFIDTKYKQLLSAKGLTRTDIEKIEADYRAEVDQSSSKNIKLLLDSHGENYDPALASKVLTDITTSWNKMAIEKLGVSRAPMLDGLVLNAGMKEQPPYVVLNYLNDFIFKAQAIIRSMRSDPNSNAYRDTQTNLNLSGVYAKLTEISTFQVDRLDAFVAISTKPSDWEVLETQYKLKELRAYKELLLEKAKTYGRALADYSNNVNKSTAYGSGDRGRSSNGGDGSSLQIDGDAISKLLALAGQAKDAEYRQKLTTDRISMENEASDLDLQIQKLERRLAMASKSNQFTDATKKQYQGMLDGIFVELTSIIGIVTRIQIDSQKDFVGNSGMLFTVINQPQSTNPGRTQLMKAGQMSLIAAIIFSVLFTLGQLFYGKVFSKSEA